METLSTDEVIERIAKSLREMSGEDLAELYNQEFGEGMTYLGDDLFEQPTQPGE